MGWRAPLYRNGLALVANSGITSVLGVAYWSLAARTSSPTVVGINAALVSALVACSNVSQAGLGGGLISYLPTQRTAAGRLVKRAYVTTALLSLVLGGGFVVAASRSTTDLGVLSALPLALLFVASVPVWSVFGLQDNVLTGLGNATWVPVENIGYSALKLTMVVLIGGAFGGYGIFISWTLPALLALLPVTVTIFRSLLPQHHVADDVGAPAIPFGRFVAGDSVGMVCSQLSTTLLPVLVVAKAGVAGGALFYIPWMLAQSVDLIGVNVGMSLTVEGARSRDGVRKLLRRLLVRVVPGIAVIALILGAAAPIVLAIFGRDYTESSVTILRLLLIGSVFRATNALVLCASRAELAVRRILGIQGLLAAVVPSAAWLLMGPWGATGAAVAWLAGQAVTSVVGLSRMRTIETKGRS